MYFIEIVISLFPCSSITTFPHEMKYRFEILGNEYKITETDLLYLEYS